MTALARMVLTAALVAVAAVGAVVATPRNAHAQPDPPAVTARPVAPVLAYYYIWWNRDSWDQTKSDAPQLGTYTSDDAEIMRQHVRLAKSAGITGFVVSWKDTPTLSRRLQSLIDIARSEEFKLAINYESLDVNRNPLPIDRVEADIRAFETRFAADPGFQIFDRPLLVWSGTWKYSREDIARVAAPIRQQLLVLASEKDEDGYRRLADVVGGNAYYWSSVDPEQDKGHGAKLSGLGALVHQNQGIWVAPFAPGFDARLIGGQRFVDRRDGATLREQFRAALDSSPDALGLISWNEFSENTHVEPSVTYGDRYLQVLRDLTGTPAPQAGEQAVDSSRAAGSPGSVIDTWLPAAFVALLLASVAMVWSLGRATTARHSRGHTPTGPFTAVRPWIRSRWAVATLLVMAAVSVGMVGLESGSGTPSSRADEPLPYYFGNKPARSPNSVVVAAAGDIACAADQAGRGLGEERQPHACQMQMTADLVSGIAPDAVLALGDLQYPNGSLRRFREGYDTSWGRFKDITYPVVGNHEYSVVAANGYFDYFGDAAGAADAGYYSYDLGAWHVVALNSECDQVGGCELGSPQERWLRSDLAAHPAACTLVYWHHPRFTSGKHGSRSRLDGFWRALSDGGADLVLTAHDHDYERLAPLNAEGQIDHGAGIRSFVVGTGGSTLYRFQGVVPGSEVRLQDVFGVLKLTLRPSAYDWEFVGEPGSGITDTGSDNCH